MKKVLMKGLGYGLTSGVITTLGMMVGLNAGTGSKAAVLGGIMIIAVGDSMSDALGIHISEEASALNEKERDHSGAWGAAVSTFVFKVIFASIFVVPVLLLPLETAVWVSVGFGMFLIALFSYLFAKRQQVKPTHVVFEHLAIAILVVILTHLIGDAVSYFFPVA